MNRTVVYGKLFCAMAVIGVASHAATVTADFASTNGNFTGAGVNGTWAYAASAWSLTQGNSMDTTLTSPTLTASGGAVTLQFRHTYNFEASFDGGQLELSLNGGAFGYVPGASFSQNGYNSGPLSNPVITVAGFSGRSGGGVTPISLTSIASLGTLTGGDTFAFRFRAASDLTVNSAPPNWLLNSITLTNTEASNGFVDANGIPEPGTSALVAFGVMALAFAGRRRSNR